MNKYPLSSRVFDPKMLSLPPSAYFDIFNSHGSISSCQKKILTLAIPTYNRPLRLKRVLRALSFALGPNRHQWFNILVSINGSAEPYQPLRSEFADLPVTFCENRSGTNFGSNLQNLARLCTTKYMILQGDDDWLPPLNLFYLSRLLLDELTIDMGTLRPAPLSHPRESRFSRITQMKDYFDRSMIFDSYRSAVLIHTLFEPICGIFISTEKLRDVDLDPPGNKLIFPQHCWLTQSNPASTVIVYTDDSVAPIANAFEDFIDKVSHASGILTLTYGLPERLINRLAIFCNQYVYASSNLIFFYIYQLWRHDALVTQEFFLTDSSSIAASLSSEPTRLRDFTTELLQMPILLCIPSVFVSLHASANDHYIRYYMLSMGLSAFFLKLIECHGDISQRIMVFNIIRSCIAASSWHPSIKRFTFLDI
jgi:glycosyltransferase involved in cell wall biosynthesis